MRLLAMVEDPANVARFLAAVGEATEVPLRSPCAPVPSPQASHDTRISGLAWPRVSVPDSSRAPFLGQRRCLCRESLTPVTESELDDEAKRRPVQ